MARRNFILPPGFVNNPGLRTTIPPGVSELTPGQSGADPPGKSGVSPGRNSAPTAAPDFFTVAEDVALSGNLLLANGASPDTDPDGDALNVTSIDLSATIGSVTVAANGDFTYDQGSAFDSLGPGETATDTFSYTITDTFGATSTATVTVTITGDDDPPTIIPGKFTVSESVGATELEFGAFVRDAENDPFIFSGVTTDLEGFEFSWTADGKVSFSTDQFEYLGAGEEVTITFFGDVTQLDAQSVAAAAFGPIAFNAGPENGGGQLGKVVVAGENSNPVVIPGPSRSGIPGEKIPFTVAVSDPDKNDLLRVTVGAEIVDGGTFPALGSAATDVELISEPLPRDTDLIVQKVIAGLTVEGPAKAVRDFFAEARFEVETRADAPNGRDARVTVLVVDEAGGFANETIEFDLARPPAPPQAGNDRFETAEDTPVQFSEFGLLFNDFDPNGTPLAFEGFAVLPSNGTIKAGPDNSTGPTFIYTPNPDFNGMDTLVYRISSGGELAFGRIDIDVSPVNDEPEIVPLEFSQNVRAGERVTLPFFFDDIDDDETLVITIRLVGDPLGDLTFSRRTDFNGVTVLEGPGFLEILGAKSDVELFFRGDGDSEGSEVSFIAFEGISGQQEISFTIIDGAGASDTNPAFVIVLDDQTNRAPIVVPDEVRATEDKPLFITSAELLNNDTDPDGDNLRIIGIARQPDHGTLMETADGFTYTPDPDFNGTDSFEVLVTDQVTTVPGTVTIEVAPVNDAPRKVSLDLRWSETDSVQMVVLADDFVDPENDFFSAVGYLPMDLDFVYSFENGVVTFDPGQFDLEDGETREIGAIVTLEVPADTEIPVVEPQLLNALALADETTTIDYLVNWVIEGVSQSSSDPLIEAEPLLLDDGGPKRMANFTVTDEDSDVIAIQFDAVDPSRIFQVDMTLALAAARNDLITVLPQDLGGKLVLTAEGNKVEVENFLDRLEFLETGIPGDTGTFVVRYYDDIGGTEVIQEAELTVGIQGSVPGVVPDIFFLPTLVPGFPQFLDFLGNDGINDLLLESVATDPEGDGYELLVTADRKAATIAAVNALFTGKLEGEYTATATDGTTYTSTWQLTARDLEENLPPAFLVPAVLTIAAIQAYQKEPGGEVFYLGFDLFGRLITMDGTAVDGDGDPLKYTRIGGSVGGTVNISSDDGTVSFARQNGEIGSEIQASIRAFDPYFAAAEALFTFVFGPDVVFFDKPSGSDTSLDVTLNEVGQTVRTINPTEAGFADADGDLEQIDGAKIEGPGTFAVASDGPSLQELLAETDSGTNALDIGQFFQWEFDELDRGTAVAEIWATDQLGLISEVFRNEVRIIPSNNQAPVALGETLQVRADESTAFAAGAGITANDFDPDDTVQGNDGRIWTVLQNGAKGVFVINPDGSHSYTAEPGARGTDTATYLITDNGGLSSEVVEVTFVIVADDNTAPTSADDGKRITLPHSATPVALGLAVPVDQQGDPITITVLALPEFGTVALADGTPLSAGQQLTFADYQGLQFVGDNNQTEDLRTDVVFDFSDHTGLSSNATIEIDAKVDDEGGTTQLVLNLVNPFGGALYDATGWMAGSDPYSLDFSGDYLGFAASGADSFSEDAGLMSLFERSNAGIWTPLNGTSPIYQGASIAYREGRGGDLFLGNPIDDIFLQSSAALFEKGETSYPINGTAWLAGGWINEFPLTIIGYSLAVDGDLVISGSGPLGTDRAAYINNGPGGLFQKVRLDYDPNSDNTQDAQGMGVGVIDGADMDTAIVSSYGRVDIYETSGTLQELTLAQTLVDPANDPGSLFGSFLRVIDRSVIAVGALEAEGGGAVHLYEHDAGAGDWVLFQTLRNPGGAAGDMFGVSFDGEADLLAVGASGDDEMGEGAGAVYRYERGADDQYALVGKLTWDAASPGDALGSSVAQSGEEVAATVPGADGDATDEGAAVVFGPANQDGAGPITGQGGAANDLFVGTIGADTYAGGAGDDRMDGAGGGDTFTGGAGADAFVIDRPSGPVTVTDFDVTEDILLIEGENAAFVAVTDGATGAEVLIRGEIVAILTEVSTDAVTSSDVFDFL